MTWSVRRSVYSVIVRAWKNTTTASGGVCSWTAANTGDTVGSVGPICCRPLSLKRCDAPTSSGSATAWTATT